MIDLTIPTAKVFFNAFFPPNLKFLSKSKVKNIWCSPAKYLSAHCLGEKTQSYHFASLNAYLCINYLISES